MLRPSAEIGADLCFAARSRLLDQNGGLFRWRRHLPLMQLTPSRCHNEDRPPYEGVEIQNVAGHSFFVVEGADEGQAAFQLWLAVDKVQSIRIFNRLRDAEQFLGGGGTGR